MRTVLVADDHPMFREALASTLRSLDDQVAVLESGSFGEAVERVAAGADIDLILLDLRMPGMNGVKGVRSLRVRRPDIPVAVVSALADSYVMRECFDAGAVAYIPKSLSRDAVIAAITTILDGGTYAPTEGMGGASLGDDSDDRGLDEAIRCRFELLTNQQRKVLELMSEGKLNKQIAYIIDVQITTVKAHVSSLLQKLGVSSRTQAVILYQKYRRSLSAPN
ncbi:response regulator transcription factor [Reyranella sp. CPCC 100927]|uniref:response regulator transcription factor n=1 Tax=Reyranella sp. CPCC 100927 TaxID=2599616 RepID=UPI0011B51ACC|nr:response regulator transcription factor [Reyranella sp. CPCC 100927]TWT15902.1 response regulator transcription factor [Reyranella sp. CPCC 100927]